LASTASICRFTGHPQTPLSDAELLELKLRIEEYCRDVDITTRQFIDCLDQLRKEERGGDQ
jgi:hypothetical protein